MGSAYASEKGVAIFKLINIPMRIIFNSPELKAEVSFLNKIGPWPFFVGIINFFIFSFSFLQSYVLDQF